jgi:hypothetical protein
MYDGPISGVVNARTRASIRYWKEHNYRCPVVIEAWNMQRTGVNRTRSTIPAGGVNIWKHDQIADTGPRMFFRDFTRYYTYPVAHRNIDYHVLGTYQGYSHRITIPDTDPEQYIYIPMGGPLSMPLGHTWREAEALPETLIPITLAALQAAFQTNPNNATASTMRVVRAASEQECLGFIDSVNDYDGCITSIGLCHWTFALPPTYADQTHYRTEGELAGFFAYFRHYDQAAYQRAFGNFGIYPSRLWTARGAGNPLWNNAQRKYSGWIHGHLDSFVPNPAAVNFSQLRPVDNLMAEANYYKNWHWFFRFVMAGRTIMPLHRAMWNAIRIRIDDLSAFTVNVPPVNNRRDIIGNVFTSERNIALLLRLHIYSPAGLVTMANRAIARAVQNNPGIDWNADINTWTDAHEEALFVALYPLAWRKNDNCRLTAYWPHDAPAIPGSAQPHNVNLPRRTGYRLNNELGDLRTARNSFILDNTGI